MHGKVRRIDVNFIVDYLHAFNIFVMNSWYAEEFYAPIPHGSQKRLGPLKNFWTNELNCYSVKAEKGSK